MHIKKNAKATSKSEKPYNFFKLILLTKLIIKKELKLPKNIISFRLLLLRLILIEEV